MRAAVVVLAAVLTAGCTSVVSGTPVPPGTFASTPPSLNGSSAPAINPSVWGGEPVEDASLRSSVHAVLPGPGTPMVGDVRLPKGRPVQADSDGDGVGTGPPVMWVSEAVLTDAFPVVAQLQREFAQTGLWAVVLQSNETDPDDGRPWRDGEFDPAEVTPIDGIDVVQKMADLYAQNVSDMAPDPQPAFPGLRTPARPPTSDYRSLIPDLPGRVGLVAVQRPADLPAKIGWLGATNYFDAGVVSAVLRSWEDRYGAVLVRIGFDYLEVVTRRPADRQEEANQIVAEQMAFCPDQIWQGDFEDPQSYGRSLLGQSEWYCWWD